MGHDPRRDLPPELERRIAEIGQLAGPAREAAIARLLRDHPEHGPAIADRFDAAQSRVATGAAAGASLAERLRQLGARGGPSDRYDLRGEVARGGMGVILRAYDQDLGRVLAMKVVLGGAKAEVDPQVLERFVEEAQITGQLDHPGVVPVHELGLDAAGRAYFTMRLVRGATAQEVFALARSREQGWTLTRALEVLLKVCDTLAYAHEKGVVHRDLKPSNVMVGKFGEVYVMDWGLAKVLGQQDSRDLRLRPPTSTSISRVRTDRSREHESDPDSALRTMDGAIVGTPCYMPPEQAHGHVEQIGVRSDVYAIGAMLYTLLTGVQPYVRPGSPASPYMILDLVRERPPAPIHQLDRSAPAELVAICERAMAREPEARYPNVAELADDLRAFLENRVVRAYRTGARAELLSWMRRNRGIAAGLAAAMLALAAGGAGALVYARQAETAGTDAKRALATAETEKQRAERALADLLAEQHRREQLAAQRQRDQLRADSRRRYELDRMRLARDEAVSHAGTEAAALERLAFFAREVQDFASTRPFGPMAAADQQRFDVLEQLVAAWPEGEGWQRLVRGHRLLAAGDATARLQFGVADGSSWQLQVAAASSSAAAALHAGDPLAALGHLSQLAAQLPELSGHMPGQSPGDLHLAAVGDWQLALHRDVAWILVAEGTAPPRAPMLRAALQGWCSRELVDFAAGDCGNVLGTAAASERHLAAFRCAQARHVGMPASALELPVDLSQPTAARAAHWIERARCRLAVHDPHGALAELDEALGWFPGRTLLPQYRVLQECRAQCLSLLGRHDAALAALDAAAKVTAPADTQSRRRQAERRSEALQQLGRPEAAERARAQAQALAGGQPAPDPAVALLSVADAALREGRADASTTAALERTMRSHPDPWLIAHAGVLLGRTQLRAAQPAAALSSLTHAARAMQRWMLEHARFRGEPLDRARVEAMRATGAAAIDALGAISPSLAAGDGAAAWQVLETFRDPVAVVLATRPIELRAPGLEAGDYVRARARWLADHLHTAAGDHAAPGLPAPDDGALTRFEASLRGRWPAYCGAVVPRVPPLVDVRRALAAETALVVLATGDERGVAFVLTRDDAELVPFPLAGGGAGARATALLAPVLASRPLAAGRCRRLVLAPCRELHALPFASSPGDDPLLQRFEVAHVASGSAWYDQRLSRFASRGTPTGQVVLVDDGTEASGWLAAALAPGGSRPTSKRLVGAAATGDDLRAAAAGARAIGIALPLAAGPTPTDYAAMRTPAGPDRESVLLPAHLRDLATGASLLVLHAPEAGNVEAAAAALAAFARAAHAAGVADVVTLAPDVDPGHAATLVQAVARAQADGVDTVAALATAARAAVAQGASAARLDGIRLWSAGP